MIEAGANEIPEDIMLDAIKIGHEQIKRIIAFIEEIVREVGKEKITYTSIVVPDEIFNKVESLCREELTEALMNDDKTTREKRRGSFRKLHEKLDEEYPDLVSLISEAFYKLQKK